MLILLYYIRQELQLLLYNLLIDFLQYFFNLIFIEIHEISKRIFNHHSVNIALHY
jgi:hypothetical protein